MTPQKTLTASAAATPLRLQHARSAVGDSHPGECLDVSGFRHDLSDEEREVHIFDCERLWRAAYQRFQDFGNPHDRDEALQHLHRMNEAILGRSRAVQAQRHRRFEIDRLREALIYEPGTGVFRWRCAVGAKAANDVAGSPHIQGYISICVDGVAYLAHRLAWAYVYGEWPDEEIDHKNRIKTDNRIDNLRKAGRSFNEQNRTEPQRNNRTGLLGVSPKDGRYRATIMVSRKQVHLGVFDTPEQAHTAYLEAKQKYHPGAIERALDDGVDYFQVQGAAARQMLERRAAA